MKAFYMPTKSDVNGIDHSCSRNWVTPIHIPNFLFECVSANDILCYIYKQSHALLTRDGTPQIIIEDGLVPVQMT